MSVVKKCFKLLQLRQHFNWIPEREVMSYLLNWNRKLNMDEYGNLYLINPGTPLLCAHMDTVQKEDDVAKLHTLRLKDWIIKANDAIIGWDDKCWIAIAMELYEKLWNKVSLLFTRQEEVWMIWAGKFCEKHSDLIKQCTYCLVFDRRNPWDIIWYNNEYCSKEFENEIHRLTKEFGYKPTTWFASDTKHIAQYINWVNLSVGYYNPHTKTEYIKCDELMNAYEAALYIIQHLEWEYPIYKKPEFKWWSAPLYSRPSYDYSSYDDDKWMSNYKYSKKKSKDKTFSASDLAKYFEVLDWGILHVKEDIFLTDIESPMECTEIREWEYAVCWYQ